MGKNKTLLMGAGPFGAGAAALAMTPIPGSAASSNPIFSLCFAGSEVVTPDRLTTAWSLAPEIIVPLMAIGLLYIAMCRRSARTNPQQSTAMQRAMFATGYVLLLVALISPLCRLAATLASAHMIQHILLVAIVPPLLVLGLPSHALPRFLRVPAPLWLSAGLYGAAIWMWHIPGLYHAALLYATAHLAMYASLLLSSGLFWHAILHSAHASAERRAGAVLVLLATLMHTGMLGALLSFAPRPWYPIMTPGAIGWGFSPLEDQQFAGLIMWVPMGLIYLLAAVALIGHGLARLDSAKPLHTAKN